MSQPDERAEPAEPDPATVRLETMLRSADPADRLAGVRPVTPPAKAPTPGGVPFVDLNFKLVVIDELMYNQSVLTPTFDVRRFAAAHEGREIDIEKEGYDAIPEAMAHFADLPLTAADLVHVTRLYLDGGNEIYGNITPFWDGEDGTFDVRSFADVAHLPNLREIEIVAMVDEDADRSPLHERGIAVTE